MGTHKNAGLHALGGRGIAVGSGRLQLRWITRATDPSLHLCAPSEHDVGWRWAQAAEEVDKINVEVRRPPNSAIAKAKLKIVRAFRICFPR
jgi:hypothetical protein